MPTTQFPMRPRRDDPEHGYMVVVQMVEYLRDQYDAFKDKFARGVATVPNGATTVVVNLGVSLGVYSVALTPTADPGGRFWVSAKTTTTFTISLSAAAPPAGIPFDWLVKGA